MPHSSGGGFSGGGSHGGIHSGSGYGNGANTRAGRLGMSRTFYPGARTFVYYRGLTPCYVYASVDLTDKKSRLRALRPLLFFFLLFMLVGCIIACCTFFPPTKLDGTNHYQTTIVNDDGVFTDTTDLLRSLNVFKAKTGITPVIVATTDTSWKSFSSLETYAYNYYVTHYYDETHWVIVCCMDGSGTLYFEGMQGDETDGILTERVCDEFNSSFINYYIDEPTENPEQALTRAFDKLNETVMDVHVEVIPVIVGILIVIGCIIAAISFITKTGDSFSYDELKEVTDKDENGQPKTAKCEYCDCTYVVGTCNTCPHCGAKTEQ